MSTYYRIGSAIGGGGGGGGTVMSVTASSPLFSSGGTTPNISIQQATTIQDGYLSAADWNTFNSKQSALTFGSISTSTSGLTIVNGANSTVGPNVTVDIATASSSQTGLLSSTDWNTFNNKADLNSPAFTGIPTAPTASIGTSTTQLATTAFVLSQGFSTGSGSIPSTHQSSTSIVTSATTTYVTAITTTITTTAASAPIYAMATAALTTTTAASVAKYRVSINGVAGQEQLVSLTATATNYTAAVEYISTALGPGTYTILFEIARNSGTGTVNFFEGTLDAIALQGASSNGITRLTGDVTAGPGSGSQVATIANGVITGAKIAAATITGSNIAATTITNANISTVDASKITTGTLPFARGGTGATAFPNQRIPFSNGTIFTSDANFIYDTTNIRLTVGGSGTARIGSVVASGSTVALQAYSEGTNNAFQIRNNNAFAMAIYTANATPTLGSLVGFGRSRGTQTSRTQSLNGDTVLNLGGFGYTGSADSTGFTSLITMVQTEDTTVSANGGEMFFSTTPNTTTTAVERLRIKQDGVINIANLSISLPVKTDASKNLISAAIDLTTDIMGTLSIGNGGTGQTTANAALNALLPSQTGNSGKFLTTNGTSSSWATVSGGGAITNVEYHTITAPEASAKQFTLINTPTTVANTLCDIITGGPQAFTLDFTIVGNVFDWNGLGLDGILDTGDIVRLNYLS